MAFRFGALVWVAEPIPPTFFGRGQDRLWPRWAAWVHWTPDDRRSRITLYLLPNPALVAVSAMLFGVALRLFSKVATRQLDPSFATLIIAWCVFVDAIGWVLGRKLSLEQEYRLLRSDTLRALQAH